MNGYWPTASDIDLLRNHYLRLCTICSLFNISALYICAHTHFPSSALKCGLCDQSSLFIFKIFITINIYLRGAKSTQIIHWIISR